uniref:MULE transposase domain-containing protein n=1 Tax=Lactuca sativa TaxID=4236 RepID=A0A9R1WXX8_LACSA|nr:hypothetical protein LSAT_V11C800413350 [Lactuca sativa]
MSNSGRFVEKNVKPKDILSAVKKHKSKKEGKTQMQGAMEYLDQNGYIYYSRENVLTKELGDLFFAHLRSLEIWRAFPHVLLIDATYKSNKYGMPLSEIVGVTPTNMTFSIAFVYMHEEKQSNCVCAFVTTRKFLTCILHFLSIIDSFCYLVVPFRVYWSVLNML